VTDPRADEVLDAEAIAWAADRAGASFSRTRDMTDFGYPVGAMPVADVRLIDAPPPDVQILSDSVLGRVREVTLTVRSRLRAEMLRFQLDPARGTRILSMNGMEIEVPDSLRWVEHYGVPDSAGVVLELRMPADEPIGMHVVEHHLRPRELVGPAPFERPDDLMPDVSAMSDRAVFRYSVAAYADPRHAFMPGAPGAATPVRAAPPSESEAAEPDSTTAPVDTTAAPNDSTTAPLDTLR
jgi:hypothetical protein